MYNSGRVIVSLSVLLSPQNVARFLNMRTKVGDEILI